MRVSPWGFRVSGFAFGVWGSYWEWVSRFSPFGFLASRLGRGVRALPGPLAAACFALPAAPLAPDATG